MVSIQRSSTGKPAFQGFRTVFIPFAVDLLYRSNDYPETFSGLMASPTLISPNNIDKTIRALLSAGITDCFIEVSALLQQDPIIP